MGCDKDRRIEENKGIFHYLTNLTETGKFGLEMKNERDDTLVEWAISRKYKIIYTVFQKKTERKYGGNAQTE